MSKNPALVRVFSSESSARILGLDQHVEGGGRLVGDNEREAAMPG